MQTFEFKLVDIVALLAHDLDDALTSLHTRHCAVCETPLKADPVQVLVEWRDWHAGWQPFTCPHCSHTETRFVIVVGNQPRIYQTHPVCQGTTVPTHRVIGNWLLSCYTRARYGTAL